jgi:hypothetical protein
MKFILFLKGGSLPRTNKFYLKKDNICNEMEGKAKPILRIAGPLDFVHIPVF